MKPGVRHGLTEQAYNDIDAIRSSTLSYFRRSALHARHQMQDPRSQTPSMAMGSALHFLLLWPDQFAASFAVAPTQEKRSKKDKDAWAEVQAAYPDATMLRPSEWDDVHKMRDSVFANGLAKRLLTGKGKSELTVVWKDEETGLLCKARLDRLIGHYVSPWDSMEYPAIIDVKSTRDARPNSFQKSIADFGYEIQAAHYLAGAASTPKGDIDRRYVFICVENSAPYATAVYELDDATRLVGEKRRRRYLNQLAECIRTGQWPGYPEEPISIGLPEWLHRIEENRSD